MFDGSYLLGFDPPSLAHGVHTIRVELASRHAYILARPFYVD